MAALPYALYRYFDEGARLLYIGISGHLPTRQSAHFSQSRWMELAASSTFERFGTAREVLAAEKSAIMSEHPLFNVQHNDTPEARQRLADYLDKIGRPDLLRQKAEARPMPALPAWSDDERSDIIDHIREVLQQRDLASTHRLLAVANLLLTGQSCLPRGAPIEDLAAYCGISVATAYRSLAADRVPSE